MSDTLIYELRVNGEDRPVESSWLGESLLHVLRERLGLYGTKNACEQGECGSCSVLVDGRLVCACLELAGAAVGCEIVTVEGLDPDGALTDVQQAFVDCGAVQCGFCTPGLIVATHDLLDRNPAPAELEIREALAGNLCRCTGYGRILVAVETVAGRAAMSERRAGQPTGGRTRTAAGVATGLGADAHRPDGIPKVRGEFEFSSDAHVDGMLWGRTLRSPHPSARIRSIDVGPALAIPGVAAVVTAADVPGRPTYGLISADQPVYATEVVRFAGEPVASVAAESPETARRACEAIVVDYEVLAPLVDAMAAVDPVTPPVHPAGNIVRHLPIRFGDQDLDGAVAVEGTYEIGMQDQAFMGPESGLAVPASDGGIDLHVSTQFLHVDRDQVAACLDLPPAEVRVHLAGVGGAFGAREDVSFHVHGCLLALRTGRPVKFSYLRDESFLGHVHRHPGRIRLRLSATPSGELVSLQGQVVLDGGAYASSSWAVIANAARFLSGPYRVAAATVDAWVVRTNNPPCGAMRGFGAVQACFAHESLMDRLADALGMDPVELRLRNALRTGDRMITGQLLTGTVPVREVILACRDLPAAPPLGQSEEARLAWPGGAGRTADRATVRRGVGFAVGWKNLMFSEGHDDDAWAACRLESGVATIVSACAEVGQGWVTIAQQIGRTMLGTPDVVLEPASTATIGTAGSTSASRQTWMSGGAVELACAEVAEQVRHHFAADHRLDVDSLEVVEGRVRSLDGSVDVDVAVAEAVPHRRVTATVRHQHAPTYPLDDRTGQGDCDVAFAFVAHRATVDVDADLGLVRVVQMATAQDVGVALNPRQVVGQLEGGIAQGVGLAVMEEIVMQDGHVRNASFTDYLIPTMLDTPTVEIALIEQPEPHAPFGAKGVGEPPTLSSTPAVVAALRQATGLSLDRVPVRPQDIALG
jgi:xanthine dehydrogenase D subunit